MKHLTQMAAILLIVMVAALLLNSCSSSSMLMVSKDEFAKVKVLAFTGVTFAEGLYLGNEIGESTKRQATKLVTDIVRQKLAEMGDRFSLIEPAKVNKAFTKALQDLDMPAYPLYDVKTGKLDDERNSAFLKYVCSKLGADGILDMYFIPGSVERSYVTSDGSEIWSLPTIDLFGEVADVTGNTLWWSTQTVGLQQERTYCINVPGCPPLSAALSLGQRKTKTFSPEDILSEKNLKSATNKTMKNLEKVAR